MCRFIVVFKTIFFEETQNGFFPSSRLLGFIQSSLFQCILNFQSHHYWFATVSFLFISFSSSFFLLNFLLFSCGSFCPNLSTHQPPPIACNKYLRFSFGMGWLGSSTCIFWNNYFMKSVYIWQSSMKLCSKDFIEQAIESMVVPSDSNYVVVEFVGSGQPPPLFPSSQLDDWFSLFYASIEHMMLYLSVLSFIIYPSNNFPFHFLQIDVLYNGPPVIQS